MEYKSAYSSKQVDGRVVTGITAVIGNVDDGGDRIMQGAFAKTLMENKKRIKHLWQHDSRNPPIAVIKDIREVPASELPDELLDKFPTATGGLEVVREYLTTPRAEEVLQGIVSGAITEMSFGYDVIKADFETSVSGTAGMKVRNLRELRLWDTSDVNWGMNAATMAVKSAVPFRDTGVAAEDTEWSAPTFGDFTDANTFEELTSAEKTRIMNHFAFSVNSPPEVYGDLKLPHHQAAKSGIGPAVWRGVAAAMAALMGARGGVDIPDADRRGVYDHLARHYEQFEKIPPDFKLVELSYRVNAFEVADYKTGRVLSATNMERLRRAIIELQDVLASAEPLAEPEKAAALTETLLRKLAIAERDPIIFSMR